MAGYRDRRVLPDVPGEASFRAHAQECGPDGGRILTGRDGGRAPGLATNLLRWFEGNRRDLPWRRFRDPYTTWVSEVMLQQTTVDVVVPRFEAFIERFPDFQALAAAAEDEVLAAWAGLGYYRRARALHAGAKAVVERHGGSLPDDAGALRSLPGIGAYTAGAILSLAFDRPVAAVDGNVARVAARVFLEEGEIGRESVRRGLGERLVAEIPSGRAARFNESLIELGALVCRPRDPDCDVCPIAASCGAFEAGRVRDLPRKAAPRRSVRVLSTRARVVRNGRLLLVQRPMDSSLLPGQWELPGRWGPEEEDPSAVAREVLEGLGLSSVETGDRVAEARHAITHHRIRSVLVGASARGRPASPGRFFPLRSLDLGVVTTETRKLLGMGTESGR